MIAQLWSAMWPNIFAPSVFTLLGVAISHVRHRKHARDQHEALKQHVDDRLQAHLTGVAAPPRKGQR